MTSGPKQPPPIDLISIVIGGGLGLLTLFVPILSVLGESHATQLEKQPVTKLY